MAQLLSNVFLNPLGLAFLGLLPIVVLLYILKLRRTEVVIPSTMLWMRSLHDLTANAPFQKLRRNLLMLLQLLILAALALALARPYAEAEGSAGENVCLIIDRSASMQTIEADGRTRLEQAKAAALELVDQLSGGDRMMLVTFENSADVLLELTDDRGRLREAIAGIMPSNKRSNIRDVMLVARSLAPPNQEVEVAVPDLRLVLLSDGRLSDLEELGALGMKLRYVRIGEARANAGITAFAVRAEDVGDGTRQCFVLVRNADDAPLETTLTLYLGDSQLAVEEVRAEPMGAAEALFALPPIESGTLRVALDEPDAFPADDEAWLVLQPPGYVEALLVSPPNSTSSFFLRRALGLDTRVELSVVSPENYAASSGYDLTIFNGWSPESLPPGTLLFFDTLPPIDGAEVAGDLEQPPVLATDSDHPAMRFINPGNLRVGSAAQMVLPPGGRTLLSTTRGALIADVSQGGQSILWAGFDLADSNWPLNLSFPLFVQNVVSWVPRSDRGEGGSQPTGAPLEILPEPGVDEAVITLPDGGEARIALDPTRPVYFAQTDTPGIYTVRTGERTTLYAVNLLDRNETEVAPAESITLGRTEIAAAEGNLVTNREYWRWLAAGALVVLGLEWWIFTRRAGL